MCYHVFCVRFFNTLINNHESFPAKKFRKFRWSWENHFKNCERLSCSSFKSKFGADKYVTNFSWKYSFRYLSLITRVGKNRASNFKMRILPQRLNVKPSAKDFCQEPQSSPPPLEEIQMCNFLPDSEDDSQDLIPLASLKLKPLKSKKHKLLFESDSDDENVPLSSLKSKSVQNEESTNFCGSDSDDDNLPLAALKSKSSQNSRVSPFKIENAIDYFNGKNKPMCPICGRDREQGSAWGWVSSG